MLRPAAMKRVLLAVPRDRVDAVLDAVGSLGVLHLLDLAGREEFRWVVRPYRLEEERRARRDALQRVDALVRFFAPPPLSEPALGELPPLAEVEARSRAWSAEMEAIRSERSALAEEIASLERSLRQVEALAPARVEIERLRGLRYLHALCGWVHERELERLHGALEAMPHRIVVANARGPERLVFAFALPRDAERLERALRAAGVERVELPEGVAGTADSAARALRARLDERRFTLRAVQERFEAARLAAARPLAEARAAAERALALAEARRFAGRSESVVFVAGWVPADRAESLRSAVRDATAGRCFLRLDEPSSLDDVRRGAEPVPILFRNPALVRPFEGLVRAYGAPRFGELDPTPVAAVSFWLMFGLMFGDVGHGLVLAAAGAWIFRRSLRYRDYAVILMECGLASALFGLAYGSVFGAGGWIPALWFRPMEDVTRLLRVGVGFGIALLSLALALGVANAVRRRDWGEALWGPHGLVAALAYWVAAALALRWLVVGRLGVPLGTAALLLALPLGAFAVVRALRSARAARAPGGARGGLTAALLGAAVEVLDAVVRSVAGTVSFVRLAAFAVSHAGLLLAVFAVAEVVAEAPGGTLWGLLVIVAGNAVILALEGLIVSVQTMRLVYYELFSRFHAGTGLPYRPLRLRAGAAGTGPIEREAT